MNVKNKAIYFNTEGNKPIVTPYIIIRHGIHIGQKTHIQLINNIFANFKQINKTVKPITDIFILIFISFLILFAILPNGNEFSKHHVLQVYQPK